ncbi:hypothetical protein NECAME_06367 [Necator americanus]|uniref:G-protein coupled receptors family 1 profile domain-containing protein n=1 Tax=Necator americanus TaxID=51031 RepID=W2TV30_NECAM|nr:hypothetical protein NECAME_06367 [Necator americanus]ETN85499.1 hypothetical protein NECAME_06367 [Necator americanus]
MMTVALIVEFISTILSLLCLPINVMFVYVIMKESKKQHAPFSSSFFRLCIHLSVADIMMTIFATIFFKFPIFGVFPKSFYEENWSVVPVAGVNYLGHSQAIGIIFIAINRFTAVYFPVKHKQRWWRSSVITVLMILQWTIPILFIIPLFFTDFTFLIDRSTGSVTFTARDAGFHKVYFVGLAILDGVVINTIVSALYIAIFIRVQTHVVVRKPGELAMRLALSAFTIFISYCTLGIFSVLAAMTRPEDAWMYRTLWFVVNDVLCASNAPVLLALNKPIRSVYMRKIGMESKEIHTKGSLLNNI